MPGALRKIIGWVCVLVALAGHKFNYGDAFIYSFLMAAWINWCCGDILLELEKKR